MEWKREYEEALTAAADMWYKNAIHQPYRRQYLCYASYNAGIRLACTFKKGNDFKIADFMPLNLGRDNVRQYIANIAGRLPILSLE